MFIENRDPASTGFIVNTKTDGGDKTAVLVSSELIQLQMNENQKVSYEMFLPLDKLGTEYFIVFPQTHSLQYVTRICSKNESTVVMFEVLKAEGNVSFETIQKNLKPHETFVYKQTFDFSGSRILSTIEVAIFYWYDGLEFGRPQIRGQSTPSHMFGGTYFIFDISFEDSLQSTEYMLRLLTMFDNTKVVTSFKSNVILNKRGEIVDIRHVSNTVITLKSDKHFMLYTKYTSQVPYIAQPIEQYTTHKYGLAEAWMTVTFRYVMPSNTITEFKVDFSIAGSWKLVSLDFKLSIILNTSDVIIGDLSFDGTITSIHYLYISNTYPVGGRFLVASPGGAVAGRLHKALKPLFKPCKLVETEDCRGVCNQTLVDSCREPEKKLEDSLHPAVVGAAIISTTTALSLALAVPVKYVKKKMSNRNRTQPSANQDG